MDGFNDEMEQKIVFNHLFAVNQIGLFTITPILGHWMKVKQPNKVKVMREKQKIKAA